MTISITPKQVEAPIAENKYVGPLRDSVIAAGVNGGTIELASASAEYERSQLQKAANTLGFTALTDQWEANGDTTTYTFRLVNKRTRRKSDEVGTDETADTTEVATDDEV